MKHFVRIVIAIVTVLILFSTPKAVHACSGFPEGILQIIEDSELIIKGTVRTHESIYGQNAIIDIKTVFKGEPHANQILVWQNLPATTRGIEKGQFGAGTCTNYANPLLESKDYYFLLSERHITGSYHLNRLYKTALIPAGFDEVDILISGEPGYTEQQRFNEPGWVSFLEETIDVSASAPTPVVEYPEQMPIAPLKITTSNGTQYMLPVDGQPPIEITSNVMAQLGPYISPAIFNRCTSLDCEYAPSGMGFIERQSSDTLLVSGSKEIVGTEYLYSPDGDALAVWSDQTLSIYGFFTSYSRVPEYSEVSLSGAFDAGRGVWHPDARALVYSDAEGLYIWDINIHGTEPRLLLAANGTIPYGIGFSPDERYLHVEQDDRRYHLDLVTGAEYPDGVFDRGSTTLFTYDTHGNRSSLSACLMIPFICTPVAEQGVIQVDAYRTIGIQYIECGDSCVVKVATPENGGTSLDLPTINMRLGYTEATYHEPFEASSILVTQDFRSGHVYITGDYELLFAEVPMDFTDVLDSPIASIEWMHSLFYEQLP